MLSPRVNPFLVVLFWWRVGWRKRLPTHSIYTNTRARANGGLWRYVRKKKINEAEYFGVENPQQALARVSFAIFYLCDTCMCDGATLAIHRRTAC